MAYALVVQFPVTGTLGTDADFDLRTQLERELSAALSAAGAGECARGRTESGRMSVTVDAVADPHAALRLVTGVLGRLNALHRATVVLETRGGDDPDAVTRQVVWPVPAARVA